ncbi:MAG TPA: alpha/beta hydrolase [Pseudomonadales bacterium]|nr:alpha/beta hydrolase [Pseudomonadales bacterium]
MQSHHIRTSRLNMHYLEAGSGEPLLLIHGWPQTSHCWYKVMPELAKHFRVIAPDLRGFGLSELQGQSELHGQPRKSGLPLSRDKLSADIVSLLNALDIKKAHIVGHDWGGMVAFKLALDFPDRVKKLCLIDCSTTHWPHWAVHGLWAKIPDLAEDFFAQGYKAFIRWCFTGVAATYPSTVVSPFPTQAMPGLDWCDADSLQHYITNLAQPDTRAASVSLYRDALPFYRQDDTGQWRAMTSDKCQAIWQYEGGPFKHPDYRSAICFAPEDLGKHIANPTLYVYTPMLLPKGFNNGEPVSDYHPAGDPYADSISAPFSDLRCIGIKSGHFIPEERPVELCAALLTFLGS